MYKYFNINSGGHSIRCKMYCADAKNIDSVIVFGHGFSGHKETKAAEKLAARIQKRHAGTAVITFDWPCHGEDAGSKIRLSDCGEYLSSVIEYSRKEFGTDRLFACATSFGGYLFLKYIVENGDPFVMTALRCPAVNMYDTLTNSIVSDDDMKKLSKGKPVSVGFDRKVKITREFMTELKENDISVIDYSGYADKMIIIHGTKDEIVPFDFVQKFSEKNGIEFVPVEAADHRFSDPHKMDKAIEIISDSFFD